MLSRQMPFGVNAFLLLLNAGRELHSFSMLHFLKDNPFFGPRETWVIVH